MIRPVMADNTMGSLTNISKNFIILSKSVNSHLLSIENNRMLNCDLDQANMLFGSLTPLLIFLVVKFYHE